jgi:hypothetical protein
MKYNIGETYYPVVYVADADSAPTYTMFRLSDSKYWDFENELWTLTPESIYSEAMTEATEITGLYWGELDTSMFSENTEILFIYFCPIPVSEERVQFAFDDSVLVFASAVYNRETEQTTLSCIGRQNQEIVLTASRATFSILENDGTIVLDPIVLTTSVNGIFTSTTALFEPEIGTGYVLEVIYELDGQSYTFAFPFAVV